MPRYAIALIMLVISVFIMEGQGLCSIVADSVTRMPLPSASIFDRHGNAIGISNSNGKMPYISENSYPVTIRYLGFKEKTVPIAGSDTIFLQENISELPEIIVESQMHKVIHMLAYVREYSNLTTYTDTVFLFREKMVDYMLVPDRKIRFKGWSKPRVLTSKSYYKFTNALGLDSVSDISNHHFSWSDWIGVVSAKIPRSLSNVEYGTDTIRGKYSPTEIWAKRDDRITVNVDVLADTASRKWVQNLSVFFKNNLDFENFKVRFNYNNVIGDSISPMDLTGYSFNIESNGRGHKMFRFNRIDEPFFVSTYAEVYILDKEYITVKEAKKWNNHKVDFGEIGIYEPMEAPNLQPSVQALVDRVNNIDKTKVRTALDPDYRLMSRNSGKNNFKIGHRALLLLKQATGITLYKSHKNFNNQWENFRKGKNLENIGQKNSN